MTASGSREGEIAESTLQLPQASMAEYCRAAQRARHNEIWWYFNGLSTRQGFSHPFEDADGRWWYCVKPLFAWPVDYFVPAEGKPRGLALRKLLGWQWPVRERGNSRVWMNVIHDLRDYGIESVASNKRRAVRKGLRELLIERLDPSNPATCEEARVVWNSHVERTGWNRAFEAERFRATWADLATWPGTAVLGARDPGRERCLCAWLIARVIDRVIYVDTLASHSDRLAHRPNDAIVFTALVSARAAGVQRAHYSMKSNISSLEAFKESLGFQPWGFPSQLHLRPLVGPAIRLAAPRIYQRLLGALPEGASAATQFDATTHQGS